MRGIGLAAAVVGAASMAAVPAAVAQGAAGAFSRQVATIDRRLTSQYRHSDRLRPRVSAAAAANAEAIPAYDGVRNRFVEPARALARRHGIPEALFLRLVRQESRWNPEARSHRGAMGLAQLMPATARWLGVDPGDPLQNLEGGARYLALQYRRFGSWRLALAAYNAGPGAVVRHGGVPPYRETRDYVRIVMGPG